MRGNIDHLEQPEEYHKMAVPGKLRFLWNIKLKFLNENTTIWLPANTFTPTLSAVASEYLYLHLVSSCHPITLPPTCQQLQRIPLTPPCQPLPENTFTPTLSAVFLSFPRFWRTRERLHESSKIFVACC